MVTMPPEQSAKARLSPTSVLKPQLATSLRTSKTTLLKETSIERTAISPLKTHTRATIVMAVRTSFMK